jgi:polygalacturonase
VKTNERRGGFVRNIHMSNVTATRIAGGVLAVETDVLYQWKTLMPTYRTQADADRGPPRQQHHGGRGGIPLPDQGRTRRIRAGLMRPAPHQYL